MSPSRRSSVSSTSSESPSNRYYDFIVHRLKSYGSLPLHQLVSQLSALPHNVQVAVGISKFALCAFLEQYRDDFSIDAKGNVSLLKRVDSIPDISNKRSYTSESSSSSCPSEIKDGRAKIYRLFPTYGFMKSYCPFKTSVYFSSSNFGDRSKHLLADYDVRDGQVLGFNAIKGPPSCDAKYRATKVWFVDDDDDNDDKESVHSEKCIRDWPQKSYKNSSFVNTNRSSVSKHGDDGCRSTGNDATKIKPQVSSSTNRSSPIQRNKAAKGPDKTASCKSQSNSTPSEVLSDSEDTQTEGIVQNLFRTYGFLIIKDEPTERVFFHLRNIVDCSDISSLDEVLRPNDVVLFEAVTSSAPTRGVNWEATRVWITHTQVTDKQSVEYYSPKRVSSAAHAQEAANSSVFRSSASEKKAKQSGTGGSNKVSEKTDDEELIDGSVMHLSDKSGKICFSGNDIFINFGQSSQAVAMPSVMYIDGSRVEDPHWMFNDGDSVKFDAVRVSEHPGWKAVLVWIGEKPAVDEPGIQSERAESPSFVSSVSRMTAMLSKGAKNLNWGDSPYEEEESAAYDTGHKERDENSASTVISMKEESDKIQEADSDVYMSDDSSNESCSESHLDTDGRGNTIGSVNGQSDDSISKEQFVDCSSDLYDSGEQINNGDCLKTVSQPTKQPSQPKASGKKSVPPSSNPCKPKKKEASVTLFENIQGNVFRVYRSHVEVRCKELEKPVSFFRSDFYVDGELVSEKCSHIGEILSSGDIVYLNCFKIIDDQGCMWQKATIVWHGKKPRGVKDMEPSEFIESQGLSVSCEIPRWKSFLEKNKRPSPVGSSEVSNYESMRHLNSESAAGDYASFCGRSPAEDASAQDKAVFDAVPEEVQQSINNISNSLLKKVDQLIQTSSDHKVKKSLKSIKDDISDLQYLLVSQLLSEGSSGHHSPEVANSSVRITKARKAQKMSKEVQTVVTGEIVSQAIFPH